MGEPFGPFRDDCAPIERRAQLRALQALVRVIIGPHPVIRSLRKAEGDDRLLRSALAEFDGLPALARRHVLASFAYLHYADYTIPRTSPARGDPYGSQETPSEPPRQTVD